MLPAAHQARIIVVIIKKAELSLTDGRTDTLRSLCHAFHRRDQSKSTRTLRHRGRKAADWRGLSESEHSRRACLFGIRCRRRLTDLSHGPGHQRAVAWQVRRSPGSNPSPPRNHFQAANACAYDWWRNGAATDRPVVFGCTRPEFCRRLVNFVVSTSFQCTIYCFVTSTVGPYNTPHCSTVALTAGRGGGNAESMTTIKPS